MIKNYQIQFAISAYTDMDNFERFMLKDCQAPRTCAKQFAELDKHLDWLEQFAELPAINVELSIKYGKILRSIRFGKKMAIVYSIDNNIVMIQRLMPQSMIMTN